MDTQSLIIGSKLARLAEIRAELARVKAENQSLRAEINSLRSHFDLALLAAEDLRDGRKIEIWDGWNLILGSEKIASDRAALIRLAKETGRRVWIVFDGKDENVREEEGVRISYTGGTGEHRADKFIIDFLRMAKYLGREHQVFVRTNDKDFLSQVRRIVS